jgi:hypothetical protein
LRVGASSELGTGWAHHVKTHRVMAFGRVDWLHRQQDVFNGMPVLVGGGHWLSVTPGLAVLAGKGLNVQAEVKVPVYRDLANRQLRLACDVSVWPQPFILNNRRAETVRNVGVRFSEHSVRIIGGFDQMDRQPAPEQSRALLVSVTSRNG